MSEKVYQTTLQAEIEEEAAAQAPDINQMVVHIRTCGYCGREGDGLLKCAGCGTVAYCDRRCQKKAWKGGHRELCKRIQRERAEEEEEKRRKKEEAAETAVESGGSDDASIGMTAEEIMQAEIL